MSAIRAISSAYITKHIPKAQAEEVPLKSELLSCFFNSLMNIMKSPGLVRTILPYFQFTKESL